MITIINGLFEEYKRQILIMWGNIMRTKTDWCSLVIAFLGALLGLCSVIYFNKFVLMSLSLGIRLIVIPIVYWLIALIPIIVMFIDKSKLKDLGFSKSKIGFQIIIGILIGIVMSLVFTLVPHLLGFGAYVDSGKRYQYLWQFIYEFIYCIIAIGLVEECVFRGFIYYKIKKISQKEVVTVIVSSILFGVFHIFNGNIAQMIMTACLGVIWCLCRLKIKNCSTLSLAIAHGIYDVLITVWASTLL